MKILLDKKITETMLKTSVVDFINKDAFPESVLNTIKKAATQAEQFRLVAFDQFLKYLCDEMAKKFVGLGIEIKITYHMGDTFLEFTKIGK